MTADEALALKEDGRRSEAAEKAKTFLMELLANGAMKSGGSGQGSREADRPRPFSEPKEALGLVSTRAEGVC